MTAIIKLRKSKEPQKLQIIFTENERKLIRKCYSTVRNLICKLDTKEFEFSESIFKTALLNLLYETNEQEWISIGIHQAKEFNFKLNCYDELSMLLTALNDIMIPFTEQEKQAIVILGVCLGVEAALSSENVALLEKIPDSSPEKLTVEDLIEHVEDSKQYSTCKTLAFMQYSINHMIYGMHYSI